MRKLLILLAVLIAPIALAQERINLTDPETKPATNYYELERLTLDWKGSIINIQLIGQHGEAKSCTYSGDTATTLMRALNKVNLSTRSLVQRIYDRIIADGCISGTVAGNVP